ncbi:BLUF domain-containing protein [Leeuwenhoekiella sp. A2]|uniref:BLUF domain-containing protein n=1 Tax=Leeuwenhoekiella sp. A2 TaxID=3141460 RepID=UPI003A807819
MKYAICYVSTASQELQNSDLKDVMNKTLHYNLKEGLKGILLYSEGNFLQVLEGDKKILLPLYTKIECDTRHKDIIQIVGKEIAHGAYDSYETRTLSDDKYYDTPELLKEYMTPIQGMDYPIQETIKICLKHFSKQGPFYNTILLCLLAFYISYTKL